MGTVGGEAACLAPEAGVTIPICVGQLVVDAATVTAAIYAETHSVSLPNAFPSQCRELKKWKSKTITAEYVEVDTFDSLMLALWRNWSGKTSDLDQKVKKARLSEVNISPSGAGQSYPLLRLNALPILDLPKQALAISFKEPKEWTDLRQVFVAIISPVILVQRVATEELPVPESKADLLF